MEGIAIWSRLVQGLTELDGEGEDGFERSSLSHPSSERDVHLEPDMGLAGLFIAYWKGLSFGISHMADGYERGVSVDADDSVESSE